MHNIPLLRATKKRRTNFKTSVNSKQQTKTKELKESHNKHLRKQSLLNVSVNLGQNNYLNAFKRKHNKAKQTNGRNSTAHCARASESSVTVVLSNWHRKKTRNKKCKYKRRARFIWIPTFRLIFIVFLKLTKQASKQASKKMETNKSASKAVNVASWKQNSTAI